MKRIWIITTIGAAIGATVGWFYWYQWGCLNGCTITGSPINSTLYGAFVGGLLFNSFKKTTPATDTADTNTK